MDVFLGMIKAFPYTFTPEWWLPCDGRLLPITQNQALFSLISNKFGGDGKNNFALPDLRGAETDAGGHCKYYIATSGLYPNRE